MLKSIRNKYAWAAAISASALFLASCGGTTAGPQVDENCEPAAEGFETLTEGTLTAVVSEYPPYISSAGGELSGVDGLLLTRIAEELCLELDVRTQSFTANIESVQSNNVDMYNGNMYLDEERERNFETSDPVYQDQMYVLSPDGVSSLDEMEGMRIGTVQGYLWVPDVQEVLGSDNVSLYATEEAAYQDLANGRIDAVIMTIGATIFLQENNNDETNESVPFESDPRVEASVETPQSVVLIPPGRSDMTEAINTVLAKLREDGAIEQYLEESGLNPSMADVDLDRGAPTEE